MPKHLQEIDKATIEEVSQGINDINYVTPKGIKVAVASLGSDHLHSKSQITDFPLALPANGGNADTVSNRHVDDSETSTSALWTSDKIAKELAKSGGGGGAPTDHTHEASTIENLHSVAVSGSYDDLANVPALKSVAISGSYDDLSNKPTIPTSLPANGGNADSVGGRVFNWEYRTVPPTHIWGSEGSASQQFVYNPNNIHVGNATNADRLNHTNAVDIPKFLGSSPGIAITNNPAHSQNYDCWVHGTSATEIGLPDSSNWHLSFKKHANADGFGTQLAMPYGRNELYMRSSSGPNWTPWSRIGGSSSPIKSIQRGQIYWEYGNDTPVSISPINLNKSVIIFTPFFSSSSGGTVCLTPDFTLLDNKIILKGNYLGSFYLTWQVIEYN